MSPPRSYGKRSIKLGRKRFMPRRDGEGLSREIWIQEGLAALSERGEAGVKVDVIARRLNITRGSFYWHFENRADYLSAILAEWRRVTPRIQSYLSDQDLSPAETLAFLYLFATANTLLSPGGRVEAALNLWAVHAPEVAQLLRDAHAERHRYLSGRFAAAGHPDPELTAAIFYASIIGRNRVRSYLTFDHARLDEVLRRFGIFLPPDRFEEMSRELLARLGADPAEARARPTRPARAKAAN